MNPVMNDLALICIGAGLGLVLALVAVMTYGLYSANIQSRRDTAASHKTIADWLQKNYAENTRLRLEVTTALSRLDAEQLRASSLAIQRSAKLLAGQVDQLQKVVFAQPPSPAIDFTPSGMEDEAEDDARMLADRARWQAATGQSGPFNQPAVDPLVNLSEEDKNRRVLEYFERQRAARAGFPYGPATHPDQFNTASTPPAAGSGAYAYLLDEASQIPPVRPPAPDFSGMEPEEGVELTEKGELS